MGSVDDWLWANKEKRHITEAQSLLANASSHLTDYENENELLRQAATDISLAIKILVTVRESIARKGRL